MHIYKNIYLRMDTYSNTHTNTTYAHSLLMYFASYLTYIEIGIHRVLSPRIVLHMTSYIGSEIKIIS